MIQRQPLTKLNNGCSMPLVGFGTYIPKVDENGAMVPDGNPDIIARAVATAIKVGYRHFDCASYYANERGIGNAIQCCLNNSVVKRSELFVATKVWNTDHKYERAQASVARSLRKLQLDYLDLVYIHWPCNFREGDEPKPYESSESDRVAEGYPYDYLETYTALEDLVLAGKLRAIGVSNFDRDQVQRIIDNCRIKPSVLQIEVHVYFQQWQLEEFCRQRHMVLVAYSPLGAAYRVSKNVLRVENSQVLQRVAQRTAVRNNTPTTTQQVALAFLLHRGLAIIPRALSETHMKSNFKAAGVKLSHEDMEYIKSIDRNRSMCPPRTGWEHLEHYPTEAIGRYKPNKVVVDCSRRRNSYHGTTVLRNVFVHQSTTVELTR